MIFKHGGITAYTVDMSFFYENLKGNIILLVIMVLNISSTVVKEKGDQMNELEMAILMIHCSFLFHTLPISSQKFACAALYVTFT